MPKQKLKGLASSKSHSNPQARITELETENEDLKAQIEALQSELGESNRRLQNVEIRNRQLEQKLKNKQTEKPVRADSDYNPHKW